MNKKISIKLECLENLFMLEDMERDFQEFQKEYSVWRDKYAVWQKWIRNLKG